MSEADALEARADQLRALARTARTKAQALATHLDTIATTAADDTVWKGPYPADAVTTLKDFQTRLGSAAGVLNTDADAWDQKAGNLDADAVEARAAEKKAEQDKAKTPAGVK